MIHPEYAETPNEDLNVQFVDDLVPTLSAGTYTLTAHQSVTGTDVGPFNAYLPGQGAPVEQRVEVRAPRYTIEPEWVHGAYPPDGETGFYGRVLPHVTLTRPTLPWEREDAEFRRADNGRLPWVALLVFGEKELEGDPECMGVTEQHRVTADRAVGEDGVAVPFNPRAPVPEDEQGRLYRAITVTRDQFRTLAPTKRELAYLTHLRLVKEEHQQVTVDHDLIKVGDYAVVMGNRIPRAAGGRYVAHLVSLEGRIEDLPDDTDAPRARQDQDGGEKLRLVSLYRWTFETLPGLSPGFAALTRNFVDQQGPGGSGLLLRVPRGAQAVAGPEQHEVVQRLAAGYLPVSFRTEEGRLTFAWYRGPFVPAPPERPPGSGEERPVPLRRCAAEAVLHLPRYGILDVSLAAAFTAGRSLAMADRELCAALLRLRGKLRPQLARALEEEADRPDGQGRWEGGARRRLEEWVTGRAPATGPEWAALASATPLPDPAVPPAAAGLTVERLRDDPGLLDRLRHASAPLTGATGDGSSRLPTPDDDLLAVRRWLADRRYLAGVPFGHLVPDARMLPAESLRFFHVDPAWTRALAEGALSVGLAHRFDHAANEVVFGTDPALTAPGTALTGVLIRSRLAAAWPALEVRPYAEAQGADGEKTLPVVRREHLADDVLLVVIEGVPGRVELAEPQQGVHFGIDEYVRPSRDRDRSPISRGVIRLRSLDPLDLGRDTGVQFPEGGGLDRYRRPRGENVMKIAALADDLAEVLGKDELTVSEFAIQMMNNAQRRTFRTDAPFTAPAQKDEHDD